MSDKPIKLDKKPYKGTRDFYPEDMRFRNWMFAQLVRVAQSYGYEPYDGPMLESFDLYAAKTGEEIVNKQLYHFIDQGDRKVAIRPEMTPTLARLVAARQRELTRPIRLYSTPNLWRYEQPGRGRLREHWQFNVDVLGADTIESEVEILLLAAQLLEVFEPPDNSFVLRISHRALLDGLSAKLGLSGEAAYKFAKALDKREKIKPEEFEQLLRSESGMDDAGLKVVEDYLNADMTGLAKLLGDNPGVERIAGILDSMTALEAGERVKFDPSIVRGFDYYTGTIFEIHDTHPENNRSLFGGGRYDNLVGMFGGEQISGFGFGMGDVTLENFLDVYGLKPELKREARVYAALFSAELSLDVFRLANGLRSAGIAVEMALKPDKMAKQFKAADAKDMRYVLVIGPDEAAAGKVQVKDMESGDQTQVDADELIDYLRERLD